MSPTQAGPGGPTNAEIKRRALHTGLVIPACPLALDRQRRLDERRQRALIRYYAAAGAGGLAVGVHTTQFGIRDPKVALLRPVLELARDELDRADAERRVPLFRIAGVCGTTPQATAEAALAAELRYDAALVSLAALQDAGEQQLIDHCRRIAEVIPVFGFYLQPAVGGRTLPYRFWREFCELDRVAGIKIAPFNRYQTLDVVRAVAESGREEIALYTGNDDSIVLDLITPFRFDVGGRTVERRIVGGLLGHWAVWTRRAVQLLDECRRFRTEHAAVTPDLLQLAVATTDANAALFDAANGFDGCIAGIHEVLRRQGLLEGIWLLDPDERLSPGQAEEIDRVGHAYPHLHDDDFVAEHRDSWLRP
jgi:dihydrodipicolinate synthase/N-acetylneuraminate lyase